MKHLNRYLAEFEGRHNVRPHDTIDQIAVLVSGMDGKRLGYEELVGPRESRLNTGTSTYENLTGDRLARKERQEA